MLHCSSWICVLLSSPISFYPYYIIILIYVLYIIYIVCIYMLMGHYVAPEDSAIPMG